jgi:hypothetical protein
MHLVVRAASVGGAPSTSATPKPAVQAGSSAGTSSGGTAQPAAAAAAPTSQDGTAGQAPAAVTQAVETAPSFDSHRSDPSSAGGSSAGGSSSGQHEEGASDGGGMPVGPGAMPHFGAPAGLSPMFVFGTHGSSNGLLYTGEYFGSVLRLVLSPPVGLDAGVNGACSMSGSILAFGSGTLPCQESWSWHHLARHHVAVSAGCWNALHIYTHLGAVLCTRVFQDTMELVVSWAGVC